MESNIEESEGKDSVKASTPKPVTPIANRQPIPANKSSVGAKSAVPATKLEKTITKPAPVVGVIQNAKEGYFISVQHSKDKYLMAMSKKEFDTFFKDIEQGEFTANQNYLLACMQTDEDGKVKAEEKYNFQTDCKGKLVEGTLKKLSKPVVKPIREVVKRFQKSWACEQKRNTYIVDDACY